MTLFSAWMPLLTKKNNDSRNDTVQYTAEAIGSHSGSVTFLHVVSNY